MPVFSEHPHQSESAALLELLIDIFAALAH